MRMQALKLTTRQRQVGFWGLSWSDEAGVDGDRALITQVHESSPLSVSVQLVPYVHGDRRTLLTGHASTTPG